MSKLVKAPKKTVKEIKAWLDIQPFLQATSDALLPVYDAANAAGREAIRQHNPTFAALLTLAGRRD